MDPIAEDRYPQSPRAEEIVDPLAQHWEKQWATFTHLTVFILPLVWVPVIPALIMWLMKRKESSYVDDQGKEAVNFQITLLVYLLIVLALHLICIGWLLSLPLAVFGYVCAVLGAIAAGKGQYYRYPMCLRMIG